MNTAKVYRDSEGNECTIHQMVKREPAWAANIIQWYETEIAKLKANPVEKLVMPPCNNECLVKNNNGIQCGAISKRGYHCSRLPDHKGDHVACAVECGIDVWSA